MRLRQTHGLWVNVALDDALAAAEHGIERISSEAPPTSARTWEAPATEPYEPDEADDDLVDEVDEEEEDEDEDQTVQLETDDADEDDEERRPAASHQDDDTRPRRGRRRRRGRRGDEPRPAQAQAPQPVRPASDEQVEGEGDGERGRRRRRGRRGGRRMREEPRAGDVYAWSWPSRPVGDDAYQWRGPVQAQLAPPPVSSPEPVAASPEPVEMLDAALQPPIADDGASVDVWVELPAADEAPRKGRARRGRGRAAVAEPVSAELPAEPALETVAAASPEAEPVAELAAASEPVAVAEEPVAEVAAAPAAPVLASVNEPAPPPRAVDANEIVAPPATPKRGWWRRGA